MLQSSSLTSMCFLRSPSFCNGETSIMANPVAGSLSSSPEATGWRHWRATLCGVPPSEELVPTQSAIITIIFILTKNGHAPARRHTRQANSSPSTQQPPRHSIVILFQKLPKCAKGHCCTKKNANFFLAEDPKKLLRYDYHISANHLGRLVLFIFGSPTPALHPNRRLGRHSFPPVVLPPTTVDVVCSLRDCFCSFPHSRAGDCICIQPVAAAEEFAGVLLPIPPTAGPSEHQKQLCWKCCLGILPTVRRCRWTAGFWQADITGRHFQKF